MLGKLSSQILPEYTSRNKLVYVNISSDKYSSAHCVPIPFEKKDEKEICNGILEL